MSAQSDEVMVVVLTLAGITKRFGSTLALDDATLQLRAGTVHALLGENGAGKTTLMRAAFGLVPVDAGTIEAASLQPSANTRRRAIHSAADAIQAGIGMVHQHFTNVPAMSVAENVALGGRGRYDRAAARARVVEIGARTGLALDPDARPEDLPVGAQQRLEIVKALARDARILILDEPTAVLAPAEARELLRWLRDFASAGNAVVLITHKLQEALAIADDVTVLRHGRVVLSARASTETTASLAAAMLGVDQVPEAETQFTTAGAPIASMNTVDVADARRDAAIQGASIEIHAGEIVGIAAVEGAGQHELLRALAKRTPVARGTIRLPATIGFVPEDRHRDALVLDMSATENVALRNAGGLTGRVPWRALRERTAQLVRDYDVRGGSAHTPVRALSGGNQQKLVLARELDDAPELLVVENPTRGLDIRASQEVRARLRAAAAAGTAVVVYSSDLDEMLALATRVFVVHAGIVREVAGDRDVVGRAMLGVG